MGASNLIVVASPQNIRDLPPQIAAHPLCQPYPGIKITALHGRALVEFNMRKHQRPHGGIKIDCRAPPLKALSLRSSPLMPLQRTLRASGFRVHHARPSALVQGGTITTLYGRGRPLFKGLSAYAHWDFRSTRDRGRHPFFRLVSVYILAGPSDLQNHA
ncbi:hypothetical protein FB451DRAFT_1164845 [Mycena latifolia]|nr:hypothetical protein FB451DRAFT_1164845 [Mycena latifolia]